MQMGGMLIGGIIWGVLCDKRGRVKIPFGSIFLYSEVLLCLWPYWFCCGLLGGLYNHCGRAVWDKLEGHCGDHGAQISSGVQ